MFGRAFFGVLMLILVVGVLAGIGVGAYNAGVSQGLADAAIAAQASGDTPAVVVPSYVGHYGYGWGHGGWGFGFFGIFFWILGFILIFALLRAAFGWGRWGGGGPGRGGWNRDERIAEMHRDLHRRDEQAPGSTG